MPPMPPSHWPNPLQPLACLRACSTLKKSIRCLPHHYLRFTPAERSGRHSNTSPPSLPSPPQPLTILTLPWHRQDMPPTLPSALLTPPPTHLMLSAASVLDQ
ncbi:hypothetical protein O181_118427 [Austropuccinia psidii MF-1]|uniref:Uncharacterized protein n=1 Tax=Austropuccinia psidii MF-1 TaxID=1389203 RepID=A0A9Q3KD72_9BASI|nr:hypothetical protein [Austropuccinia psidii MF-1]